MWSIERASDGAVWAGSGTDGRLYRVGPDGAGAVVFDTDQLDVHALAADREGGVFAGTSPDGRVYHVTAGGDARIVLDPDETYIWALALSRDGTLYVATGNPGRIYRVPAGGGRELVYESDATHILALAPAADGALLAGTESPGQVLRIDPTGRAFALLDAPYEGDPLAAAPARRVAARGGGERPAGAGRAPRDAPAGRGLRRPGADGLGDHERHRRRGRRRRDPRHAAGIDLRVGGHRPEGGRLSHHRGRAVGPAVAVEPGHPVRRGVRRSGGAGRRHRTERQAVSGVAESAADDPVGSGPRRAGDPAAAGAGRIDGLRHRQPRKDHADGEPPRGPGHLRVRGARRGGGGPLGHDSLAGRDAGREPHRAGHAIREHRDSQRHLERLVGRPYRCVGHPDHQPQRALPAVAGHPLRRRRIAGADLGDRRVPAAQPPARDHPAHRSPPRHRLPAVLQHERPADCRARRAIVAPAGDRKHRRPRDLSQGHSDVSVAGERRQPRSARLRRVLSAGRRRRVARPANRVAGHRIRLGHHDGPGWRPIA